MAPRPRANCQICNTVQSKYTCSTCRALYCSVACYKQHKSDSCTTTGASGKPEDGHNAALLLSETDGEMTQTPSLLQERPLKEPQKLRPLTSLKWPYIPDESAYPDPLKRDDPKQLSLKQYEAIATSPMIRETLLTSPRLPQLLRSIDNLRGSERYEALQRVLGVTQGVNNSNRPEFADDIDEEDAKALKSFATAIEKAVRGERKDALGLDWEGE
ncbi:hypothetical protein BD410DRAFT_820434 [Rickenella mellea]|uniref:HIT-type domain-containing protein n=1 Tax=Rickenella mellea TaxID=50990 RepID=A0A4Y7Q9E9_9AGAM|nr:hypothetical protein BD410DRAFT_820434 [Rickenella mellea]